MEIEPHDFLRRERKDIDGYGDLMTYCSASDVDTAERSFCDVFGNDSRCRRAGTQLRVLRPRVPKTISKRYFTVSNTSTTVWLCVLKRRIEIREAAISFPRCTDDKEKKWNSITARASFEIDTNENEIDENRIRITIV